MARNWRRLVWAAAIASAFAAAGIAMPESRAQTVTPSAEAPPKPSTTKTKSKKVAKKEPEAAEDGQPQKKKKQDPAEAQKQIEAAQKLLEGGKADAAVQSLTSVLAAGNLPPGLMARALYTRGVAQRQVQKPALAISDLTSALWLKGGLSDADRADALKQRSAAYSEAGLADPGAPPAPGGGVRTASVGETASPSASSAPTSSSWNVFGGLFGSNTQPPPQPAPAPKVAAAPAPPASPAGWSSATEVKPSPGTPVAAMPTASAPAPVAAPAGKFRVQLALVRSESEASAIASRVRGEFAGVFGPREANVEEAVVGNMGTMYRVRVGPYANAGEGQAACAKLKGSGLDCLVVAQ